MIAVVGQGEMQNATAGRRSFGDYLLLEQIGEGPVGTTFLGMDRRDGRRVVVRQAGAGKPESAALRREAKLLTSLRHDNLARLLESGEREGLAFTVMAEEDGTSLDRLPAAWRAAMGQNTVMELLSPLLTALEMVHLAGFLHGDISPRNILLRRDGTPLLFDFASTVELTAVDGDGFAAATPGFSAPERGDPARQGPGSDLFSLAAVVYWLLVGRPLAAGAESTASSLTPFADALGGDKRFSPSFVESVDAALAPAIADRPASAGDWRAALLNAGPAERADAPSLAQLSSALREEAEMDLPANDEVPPTALLRPEERDLDVAGQGGGTALRSDPASALAMPSRPRRRGAGVALAVLLILLATGGAAAGWWGWTWYRDASKLDWLVDAGGGGDTASLGEAVARAPDGATISIRPGVYAESLSLRRSLHLQVLPEDDGEVVVAPPDGRCLVVDAPSGSLRGLAFEGGDGSGACLEVLSGAVEIVGNRIGPWKGDGVLVRDGAQPLIRENRFLDIDGSAVIVDDGGGGILESNQIEGTAKSAIKARAGADPTVRGNEIATAGQAGLLIEQGAQGRYSENRIVASASSGIEVRGGATPRVSDNLVEKSTQSGLFIHEGARGVFRDNRIVASTLSGIVITGGAAPLVIGNEITDGEQHGMLVLGGAGGQITGNRIRDNKGHAIVLGGGQEAELEQNELEGNRKPQVRRIAP